MVGIRCSHCGRVTPGLSAFCIGCGSRLARQRGEGECSATAAAPPADPHEYEREADRKTVPERAAAALASLRQGAGMVIVTDGLNAGSSRYTLETDRITVGRHPDSDIHLDDVTVSRRHAEFLRRRNRFLVRDVGSVNGVYVNRERVTECTLTPRDEIRVGAFCLAYFAA